MRELEEAQIEKELKTLTTIPLSEDSISLTEKAKELNISPHTLRRVPMPGYQLIGEQLVSHALLDQIKQELEPNQQYQKVEAILQKYHLTMGALDYLGYKIIWKGLIPFKIVKKRRKSKIQAEDKSP